MLPIRMQVYPKREAFPEFFLVFSKYTLNFEYFEKKDDPHS